MLCEKLLTPVKVEETKPGSKYKYRITFLQDKILDEKIYPTPETANSSVKLKVGVHYLLKINTWVMQSGKEGFSILGIHEERVTKK